MPKFTESTLEDAVLRYLADLGWGVAHGPEIAPGEANAEREVWDEVLLANGSAISCRPLTTSDQATDNDDRRLPI